MFDAQSVADITNLDSYKHLVRTVCQQAVQTPHTTYLFLERYAYINGFAASGVALLAGHIGYSRHLFTDASITANSTSDKGMLIAAKIFAATIDEHGDKPLGNAPHRTLGQVMLDSIAQYANLQSDARQTLDTHSKPFLAIVDQFKHHYQGQADNMDSLLRAMGYHIASELLADAEYQIIDETIWFHHPDERFRSIVKRGKRSDGTWYGPWSWVTTHGHYGAAEKDEGHGVEHDHWLDAIEAIELVLRYKPDHLSEEHIMAITKEGMQQFSHNWTALFTSLLTEIQQQSNKV